MTRFYDNTQAEVMNNNCVDEATDNSASYIRSWVSAKVHPQQEAPLSADICLFLHLAGT